MTASSAGTWLRGGTWLVALGLIVGSGGALYVDGHLPASVPTNAPVSQVMDLARALEAVTSAGEVDLGRLKAQHEPLERFVASLAATAPATRPELFPTPEDRVAFWLNAHLALVLEELLDVSGTAPGQLSQVTRTWPIGGQRMTKRAIVRRFLDGAGDARVHLALFTGARGHGVLDGAPFDGPSLDAQLDDATRRFMRRPDNVAVVGKAVRLSGLLRQHEAALISALPAERKGLLQIVWAYLPESCEGLRPGCLTRGDLDRACGARLETCAVEVLPVDESLAVVP